VALFSPFALDSDAAQHRYALSFGGFYSHVGAVDGFGLGWLVDRIEYRSSGSQLSGLWIEGAGHDGVLVAGLGTHARGDLAGIEVTGLVTMRSGCVVGAQLTGLLASATSPCASHSTGPRARRGDSVFGLQFAGLGAFSGSSLSGLQVAGLAAISRGPSDGAQLSGLLAYSSSNLAGMQVAGLASISNAQSNGLQLSGLLSHASSNVIGAQGAGLTNVSLGALDGVQVSGLLNYVHEDLHGVQLSGLLNVARKVRGLQLSTVNVAREVDGLQLGFVNVARKNRGLALGLFNWSEGTRVQPTYFFQTPGFHNVGYRTVSGHSTGTISFGYDEPRKRARTHFAMGARTAFSRIALGVEFGYGWVLEHMTSGPTDRAHELDLIGTVSVELIRNAVSLYAGGGVALPVSGVVPVEPNGLAQAGISLF
jgi:hypothetical protein